MSDGSPMVNSKMTSYYYSTLPSPPARPHSCPQRYSAQPAFRHDQRQKQQIYPRPTATDRPTEQEREFRSASSTRIASHRIGDIRIT